MNILICSKRDLTSVVILNDLLPRLAALPGVRLSLWLAERTRPVETRVPELVRMKFLERDLPFGLVFPLIDDQPALDQPELLTPERLAAAHRLPWRVVTDIRTPEIRHALTALMPDLILSVRFSFAFDRVAMALPRHGILNVHPGALPRFAGLYPHLHSMLEGETQLGCTVHRVDEGLDSGPVLATGSIPIDPARSAFRHNLDSHLLGNRLLADIVARIAAGELPEGVPQDRAKLRYHTYPTAEEFARFAAAGLAVIHEAEYLDLLRRFVAPGRRLGESEAAQAVRSLQARARAVNG